MNLAEAEKLVRKSFEFPPITPGLAQTALHNYEQGYIEFPEPIQAQIFLALQIIRDQDMGKSHHNDGKRKDRSEGKRQRKLRTGSRR